MKATLLIILGYIVLMTAVVVLVGWRDNVSLTSNDTFSQESAKLKQPETISLQCKPVKIAY